MKNEKKQAIGIALGIGLGTLIGTLTNNIGLWLGIGIAIGAGVGTSLMKQGEKKTKEIRRIKTTNKEQGHNTNIFFITGMLYAILIPKKLHPKGLAKYLKNVILLGKINCKIGLILVVKTTYLSRIFYLCSFKIQLH
jgi:hypothetical protein